MVCFPGGEVERMEKRFDPASYEDKWQKRWSEEGFFVAEAPSSRPSFCIMIPPPNVTGNLHAGHALQTTLQDLLTRWTSRDSARITSEIEYGSKVFTLIDDRLPDWCVIKWGAIKRYYVVSIGHRGFNDAAQSILRSGEHTPEESKRRHWQKILGSQTAHFELQVNFDAIKEALSAVVKGRTLNVLDEL